MDYKIKFYNKIYQELQDHGETNYMVPEKG